VSNRISTNQSPKDEPSARSGSDSGTPSWGRWLATIASVAGAAAGLVAALGFPAAIVQFARLAVPIQFVAYDRVLRAGVLPALALALLVALLWGVGRVLSRLPKLKAWFMARSWPDSAGSHAAVRVSLNLLYGLVVVPLFLVVFALFLATWLVMIAAMLVWMAYPLVWEARVLGLPATIGTVVVLIGLWVRFYLPYLRRQMRRPPIPDSHAPSSDESELAIQREDPRSLVESAFEMPFVGLYAGLIFGGWLLAALFTVRWAMQAWLGVQLDATVTDAWLRVAAVLFGFMTFAGFFSGFSAPAFASQSRIRRRLAWAELAVIGASLYVAFAWQYSHEVYHWVPQSLGGGRPEQVALEYDPGSSDADLARLLPGAGCSSTGHIWRCQTAYLVEARADNWVVADGASPTARSIVVPRASVILVSGR